jgi:hypothetical protein
MATIKGFPVPTCKVMKVNRVCGGKVPHTFSFIHSFISYFSYIVSTARLYRIRLPKRMVMYCELERLGEKVVVACFEVIY